MLQLAQRARQYGWKALFDRRDYSAAFRYRASVGLDSRARFKGSEMRRINDDDSAKLEGIDSM